MAWSIIETTIGDKTIKMRLATDQDPAKADEWFELVFQIEKLVIPNRLGGQNPIGDLGLRQLSVIQAAALHYVRETIANENERLSTLLGT